MKHDAQLSAAPRQQEAEWALGNKLAAQVEQYASLIADSTVTEYLNRIEQNIVHTSDLDGCFVVKVINDVEPNAYSLPGGFLYVNSGLILTADNEAELAAALAHETGHVTARHLTTIEHKRRLWGRLAWAGGPAGYLARRLLGPILTMKLLRNAEFEADHLGLAYQNASRYDPAEFARLLQTAYPQDGKPPSFVERLVDSHPSTEARIKHLRTSARFLTVPVEYLVDTSEFQEIKLRVAAITPFVAVGSSSDDQH